MFSIDFGNARAPAPLPILNIADTSFESTVECPMFLVSVRIDLDLYLLTIFAWTPCPFRVLNSPVKDN